MPDDLINDDEQVEPTEEVVEKKPTRPDNRFTQLSEKVELTAKERDEAQAAAEAAQKEVEFYKGFSKVSSKYQGAADYQDKILEKVNAGYDLEDATISVLAKAGKLDAPVAQRSSPAGGSATTNITGSGDKPISEMTREEKRQRLLEMDAAEPGSLARTLRSIKMNSDL